MWGSQLTNCHLSRLCSDFLQFSSNCHYSTIAPYSYQTIALKNEADFILFWPYLFSLLFVGHLFALIIFFLHFIQYSFYPMPFLHCRHLSILFCARFIVDVKIGPQILQKSRRQKGDMKLVPYWELTSLEGNGSAISSQGISG